MLRSSLAFRTKIPQPATSPYAVIIFVHGFSDHCNRYDQLFRNLALAGVVVHGFDQRGWGRSVKKPSEKGLTGPTAQVLEDITSFIKSHLPSPKPLFLMGHSMGGQEVLQYASIGEVRKQINGFLALAPFIKFHPNSQPGWLKYHVGKLASKILPNKQLASPLNPSFMSHDEAMNEDWLKDELCHNTGTLEGLAGLLSRADELDRGTVVIEDWNGLHIFLAHGSGDMCTSHEATKSFMERLKVKDKTLKLYEGAYHCSKSVRNELTSVRY